MRPGLAAVALVAVSGVATAETLQFEAYELQPKGGRRLLAKGKREYSPRTDIVVVDAGPSRGGGHWSKRLPLFGKYELEADVYREPRLDGFGLVVNEQDNPNGFSWNWFDREREDVFVKRRGSGRVKVTTVRVDGKVELAAVEFLDDIMLRYTDQMGRHEPGEHTHEIVIMKGSVLRVSGGAP